MALNCWLDISLSVKRCIIVVAKIQYVHLYVHLCITKISKLKQDPKAAVLDCNLYSGLIHHFDVSSVCLASADKESPLGLFS